MVTLVVAGLVGVARSRGPSPASLVSVGENSDSFPKSVPQGVLPVAHHPEATASAMKFPGANSHETFEAGIGHKLPQEALDAYADAEVEGRRT
jgi:hypothetical protein